MNVVVTGGGTIAPIDDVRRITNVSSGRFSAAIAEACLGRGATVWHVHAPAAQLPLSRKARFDLDAADPSPSSAGWSGSAAAGGRSATGCTSSRCRGGPSPTTPDPEGVLRTSAIDVSSWRWPSPTSSPRRPRQARLRRRGAGRPLPADAQGDPVGPRLVARGLPRRVQAAVRRRPSELIRRAEEAAGPTGRPDGGQRRADALRPAGTRSTWSARPPARDPPPRRRPGRPARRARLRLVRRPVPGRRRSPRTTPTLRRPEPFGVPLAHPTPGWCGRPAPHHKAPSQGCRTRDGEGCVPADQRKSFVQVDLRQE